jgi:Rps23 Pro-64 3,4-dihydroxylase Tpa1-like proline 4-hydroxylase
MNTSESLSTNIIYDQDFIVIYRALDRKLCQSIIDRFDRDNKKWQGKIGLMQGDVGYDADVKKSWDLEIVNDGEWKDTFQTIHPKIETCLSHYLSRSPILRSFHLQATGYKIQMYPKNEGYFRWHADSVGKSAASRVIAMILYLNDVEKGGETEFYHQDIKVVPKAGNLLLFPAGWNYMHCGNKPESNDKYIIQTFIRTKD